MNNDYVNSTLNFYNTYADQYFKDTVSADMSSIYNRFLKYVKPRSHICDLGCGSGRDSKKFLNLGYTVTPIDGSIKMCQLASQYLGIKVDCTLFSDINFYERFDAVWACSSLLHIPYDEMQLVFEKIICGCKNNSVIYTCFKYGNNSLFKNGKIFSNFTFESFEYFLSLFPSLSILEHWLSFDTLGRDCVPSWLNLIIRVRK